MKRIDFIIEYKSLIYDSKVEKRKQQLTTQNFTPKDYMTHILDNKTDYF